MQTECSSRQFLWPSQPNQCVELEQLIEVSWCSVLQYTSQKKKNYLVLFGNLLLHKIFHRLPHLYEGCQTDLPGESLKWIVTDTYSQVISN